MASERWTPAIAEAAMRRHALMDTTVQVTQLRKTLGKRKKVELIDALTELARNDRPTLRNLQTRFEDNCSTDQLILATKQAIADATKVDERRLNYNFDYDSGAYQTIERNFERLIEQEQLESTMELSLTLMKQGSYQVECSDEGMMLEDIEQCLTVVFKSLKQSGLESSTIKKWADEMVYSDRCGFIAEQQFKQLVSEA